MEMVRANKEVARESGQAIPAGEAGNMSTQNIDVQQLVEAIFEKVNAPKPLSPSQQAEVQMAQQHRADTAATVLAEKENLKASQKICTHEHSKREGGGTHCTWVRDNDLPWSAGYILCQKCRGR